MKRKIYNELLKWKALKKDKMPLVLYGARQVGKTYIVTEFGKNNYQNMIYVNFEQDEKITGGRIITKYNGSASVLDLKTIFAGQNIVRIGASAFAEHDTITEVILPDTVTSIGMDAFRDCSSLEKITFSSSLNVISVKAFFGCRLSDITLPASCTSIAVDAFWGNPMVLYTF